jgi:hypothetical protein
MKERRRSHTCAVVKRVLLQKREGQSDVGKFGKKFGLQLRIHKRTYHKYRR